MVKLLVNLDLSLESDAHLSLLKLGSFELFDRKLGPCGLVHGFVDVTISALTNLLGVIYLKIA